MSGAPSSNHQPRWHLLYYALAAANLVTICVSLWLAHNILEIFHSSNAENHQWVERLNEYEKLAKIAGEVNAPGNDVFDDHDAPGQLQKMNGSLGEFNHQMKLIRSDVVSSVGNAQVRETLTQHLNTIDDSMDIMVKEALIIFEEFRQGNEKAAGARMAGMDRAYGMLGNSLRSLRMYVIHTQASLIDSESREAAQLGRFELYISFVVVFIVFGAVIYGHIMHNRLKQTATLIENQNQQLVQQGRLAALGTMAGGIAHEINNPLAVIKGYGGQLERLIKRGKLDEDAVANVSRMILKTSDRLTAIVRGLRVFSRDGSRDPFNPVSAYELIEDAKLFCAERMLRRSVTLKVEMPDQDFKFDCRMVEIGQVIINLLNNAADAVGGREGAWACLRLQQDVPNNRVRISVFDSGAPISDKIAEDLFTPFFTTKAVGEGTGLGLAICMGIAKEHHGSLTLDRSQGRNEFVLEIPSRQSREPPTQSNITDAAA